VHFRDFVAAIAFVISMAAFAPPALAESETVAVVPFAAPGSEPNRVLDDATGIFVAALRGHDIAPKAIAPLNHLAVVQNAPEICAKAGATAILVPTVRTEQNLKAKNYLVASVIYYATHAELRLSRLRCDGSLAWSVVTTGDKAYGATNVQAGVADAVAQASGKAVDAYIKRTADRTPSVPFAPLGAIPGSKIAIVPFAQPGGADPSLDFATDEALKRYRAKGLDAVVTDPVDHLAATREAPQLCGKYAASKLIMGTLRTEQTSKLGGVASHAEVLLTTVDCSGRVVDQQVAIGEHLHRGTNVRAGISSAIEDAFGHWTDVQR
jgi:hypothetical protein